jgi:hypothetical protein
MRGAAAVAVAHDELFQRSTTIVSSAGADLIERSANSLARRQGASELALRSIKSAPGRFIGDYSVKIIITIPICCDKRFSSV